MSVCCLSISTQTLWTFPPLEIVFNCPTPFPSSHITPRKLQTVLMDRYAVDSMDEDSLADAGAEVTASDITTLTTQAATHADAARLTTRATSIDVSQLTAQAAGIDVTERTFPTASCPATFLTSQAEDSELALLSSQTAGCDVTSRNVPANYMTCGVSSTACPPYSPNDNQRGSIGYLAQPSARTTQSYLDDIQSQDPESSLHDSVSSSTYSLGSSAVPIGRKRSSAKSVSLRELCQICDDAAAGFHCGAYVCEACKKFYIRTSKQTNRNLVCSRRRSSCQESCIINKHNRSACSHCRYQKCLDAGMEPPGKGLLDTHSVKQLPCKVCGSPSSGFHFGVLSCEGCKAFFRRLLQDSTVKANSLVCQRDGTCGVDILSRSQCRACRYHKCISVGMALSATRIGRQPNSVRYARIVEHRPAKTEATDAVATSTRPAASRPTISRPAASRPAVRVGRGNHSSTVYDVPSAPSINTLLPQSHATFSPEAVVQSALALTPVPPVNTALAEKVDHAMDLTLSSLEPLDLSPRTSTSVLLQSHIEQLAVMFECSRHEYYMEVTDKEMLDPGTSDTAFAQLIFEQFQRALRIFVKFSKKIQGFMQLDLEDRVLLTKCALYRFVLLAASQRYDMETGRYYVFGWRSWKAAPVRFTAMYPPYKVFLYHFGTVARKIKETGCSAEELGLLAVLNTINKDNLSDMKDSQAITRLYNEYVEMILLHTKAHYSDPTKRMKELNNVLDLCRQAAKEHAAAAKIVINEYPSYAAVHAQNAEIIPQLYKEMFSNTPWEHWNAT